METRRILAVQEERVVTRHDRASESTITQLIPQAIDQVHSFLGSRGVEPAGAPLCVCPEPDERGVMEIDTGWPVQEDVETEAPFEALTLPGGRALVMRHVGPYEQLHTSYRLMCETMEQHGLQPVGASWEVYLTDPEEVPDPADYVTEIFWPIGPEGQL